MKQTESKLAAPFPYFGGKRAVAEIGWKAMGADCPNYIEPFFGGGAMLLGRPGGAGGVETVNDKSGYVANFWRAVSADPEEVARWADWPVTENDLHARHGWLINRAEKLAWAMEDPDYYDAKIAGWWCWGQCAWIGSDWCSGEGGWRSDGAHVVKASEGARNNKQIPHLGNAGQGIQKKRPHLGNAGQGIQKKRPHLSSANRKTIDAADGSMQTRREFIEGWMFRLRDRLRDVRVCCGDWKRVCTPVVLEVARPAAVFLDPPYSEETGRDMRCYSSDCGKVAHEARAWCVENGKNPKLRIVLCGMGKEHDELLGHGWSKTLWTSRGYGKTDEAIARSKSEAMWMSPACIKSKDILDL